MMVRSHSFLLSTFLVIAGALLTCCVSYGQNPPPPVISPLRGPVTCPLAINNADPTPGTGILVNDNLSKPFTSPAQMGDTDQYCGPLDALPVGKTPKLDAVAHLPAGSDPPSTDLLSTETVTTYSYNNVWGFADLHTHPASFLGFGSDQNGDNGLIWGKPAHAGGLDLATSSQSANLSSDLQSCPSASIGPYSLGYTHNNATGNDPVKLMTDATIVSTLDGTSPGWVHQSQGALSFVDWPAGLTVDHQVMHINSIKRAFDGGLRLMFASVTNDELLSKLWKQGLNLGGNPMPTHDLSFDYNSAVAQLTYITNLVNANNTWMQIVTSPSQARAAISGNPPKLAVVLSLEMDSLSLGQIQSLVIQFGVAHVIPVHLADNSSFGGTALYSDTFNGLSNFINGSYYSPVKDPNVNFLLGTPPPSLQPISTSTVLKVSAGSVNVGPAILAFNPELAVPLITLPTGALGYIPVMPTAAQPTTPGQINSKDLNQNQFLALMQMGLLLDIVHMGQTTASTALNLAQQYHYPLMDSHTGIRCDSPTPTTGFPAVSCSTPSGSPSSAATGAGAIAVNERSLPTSQLQIIQQLGGVIGLGEVPAVFGNPPSPDPDPVTTWINNYSIALSLMGGKNVAIGTDADGLSPLIQKDTIATNYPITVASQFGCPAGCPSLNQYQLGTRTFNFQNDGIATYGLLPDFIQAASESRPISVPWVPNAQCVQTCTAAYKTCMKNWNPDDYPRGQQPPCGAIESNCINHCPYTGGGFKPGPAPTAQITALFHSAEDTIEMWEAVEKVAATVKVPSGPNNNPGITCARGETVKLCGTPAKQVCVENGGACPLPLPVCTPPKVLTDCGARPICLPPHAVCP
jgi:hypothetical protein